MREDQLHTGIAPYKKPQRASANSQTQKNAVAWRVAVFKKPLKPHSVRLGHSCPGKRRLDRWDPPSNLLTS